MSEPILTKAQVLAEMQACWNDLNAYLDTLSEAQVTQPTDAGGWTAKDHVVHLAMWEGSMNAVLQKQSRREYMGVDADTWEHDRPDGVNAIMQRNYKNWSWAEVRRKFRQEHEELVERVKALTEEDLQRPHNYYQPDSDQTHPIARRLMIASCEHFDEHRPWIEKIVKG